MFLRVKGTVDNFFDTGFWSGVANKIFMTLKRYNFSEIHTPLLEYVSLFERGLGYETDVVSKQMFVVQTKGDKDENFCLRPEATAGTMRAFLEQQAQLSNPAKFFSYGPMFRYERPQKGRLRQFHQVNIEMIGVQSILYDAYFIHMLYNMFFEEFGMHTFVLKINFLGQAQDRKQFCEQLRDFLHKHAGSLCETCKTRTETNVLRVLDCKLESCQAIIKDGPKLFDFFSSESKKEWQQLCDVLQEMSVTFVHDPHLVRGLDYYNKTVFEFISFDLGAQSAFCAGGRYDGLAQQLGSKVEIPAIGCAIGMERLLMILEPNKDRFEEKKHALICIIPFSVEQGVLAMLLADCLQEKGKTVDVLLDDQKIKNKMKRANSMGAQFVLLLGENEMKNNTVMLKNMITGLEQEVLQIKVHEYL